jgi:3-methylcrotonyl-CoA carboxylase alpha subunit
MGPKTNIAFLRGLLAAPEFVAGTHDTGFIDANLERLGAVPQPPDARAALAGVEAIYADIAPRPAAASDCDPWSVADSFELMGPRRVPFEAEVDGKTERFLAIARGGETSIAFRDDRAAPAAGIPPTVLVIDDGVLVLNGGRQTHVRPIDPAAAEEVGAGTSDGAVKAPMHGRLAVLAVAEGQEVQAGERVAVLEAMKMEHALAAPRAGRVALAGREVGDIVEQGALILRVEEVAQEA